MSSVAERPENRSPRAFARYRELVETLNRRAVRVEVSYDLTNAETNWDVLTAFEAKAFGIDPRLLHALVFAHQRYQELVGMIEADFAAFHAEEIAAYAEFAGDGSYAIDKAIGFMVRACCIPETQAILWVCRSRVQEVRSNLHRDSVAAPAWAIAAVGRNEH